MAKKTHPVADTEPSKNLEGAYNPLDTLNLGESIARALLATPIRSLPPGESFDGAGVYALYYSGSHSDYRPLTKQNLREPGSAPIYVGKAIPKGARKGGMGLGRKTGKALAARLRQHATAISETATLKLEDFSCRYLVVDEIWIPLGENMLIAMFNPVWNQLVEGFGNKNPGKERFTGKKPVWDILHPGRAWEKKMTGKGKKTQAEISQSIAAFFEARKA